VVHLGINAINWKANYKLGGGN